MIEDITVKDSIPLTKDEKKSVSFPLLYNLLSTSQPATVHFTEKVFKQILSSLSDSMKNLNHQSNSNLDLLPTIGLNDVFMTNYLYCLKSVIQLKGNFHQIGYRGRIRFNLNENGSKVELWHIHRKVSVVKGIVSGQNSYGRLLNRIQTICSNQKYDKDRKHKLIEFRSRLELFLFEDVYILVFYLNNVNLAYGGYCVANKEKCIVMEKFIITTLIKY